MSKSRQTGKAPQESTGEIDRFFDLTLDLLCIADTDGYFRKLNPQWEKTLGYTLQDLEGHRFLDFIHPEDMEYTLATVADLSAQKEVLNFVNRFRCRDGSYRWIEWRSYPAGKLIYAAARDITRHIEMEEALRRSAERRALLYQASQAISASLDMDQVYTAIHRAVEKVMPCDDFVIDLYDQERNEVVSAYAIEMGQKISPPTYYADHGLAGTIAHTGKSVLLNSLKEISSSGIQFEPYGTGPVTSSVLAVPIQLKGKTMGMISAQSYQANAYTIDDRGLLEMLASHASIALENARLFAETQQLATTDALTGTLNRRRFFELAEREFERTRRYKHPLSVLMLDMDYFKQVNDRFGHSIGDRTLQTVINLCRQELRQMDLIGRYGGDEFVILLAETDLPQAQKLAERLCRSIAQAVITPEPEVSLTVTVSLGVAALDPACDSIGTLLDHADQALYQTKQFGRNQVRIYS